MNSPVVKSLAIRKKAKELNLSYELVDQFNLFKEKNVVWCGVVSDNVRKEKKVKSQWIESKGMHRKYQSSLQTTKVWRF